ncbi:hypothetical protein [Marinigracilibium pacificum]|uniref:Uncharacterized protein n=1 Tax=Marinigracilibium pacificum TaxID=2729599 RepID=A0A848J0L2_9BACT|nr:hypothetical protein [Marinigracilibium pacificum]NMM50097.1 hypothetical protein [Marinigracilibium pacificum]
MENREKYIDDLRDIREMMNRSSRFISLSGMAGVFAGIFALIGGYLAYMLIYNGDNQVGRPPIVLSKDAVIQLLIIAVVVIFAAISASIFFTVRKAKNKNLPIWDTQTKRLLESFLVPLVGGGLVCLILLLKGYITILPGLTLVIYGMSLINASSVTYKEIKSLGIAEMILGIIATIFTGYGLFFWMVGFGVLHIVYGIIMQIRHS